MSEDLKPIATENTDSVEVQSANVSEVTANEPVGEENVDLNSKGLKELVDFFQELLDGEDVQKLHKYAESIKAAFYKTLRKEKIAAGYQAPAADAAEAAAPEEAVEPAAEGVPAEAEAAAPAGEAAAPAEAPETVSVNPFAEIERGFKDLYNRYRTIRAEHTAEMEKQKEENYEKKMGLLEELSIVRKVCSEVNVVVALTVLDLGHLVHILHRVVFPHEARFVTFGLGVARTLLI